MVTQVAPDARSTASRVCPTEGLERVTIEPVRSFSVTARFAWAPRRSNLQIEIALADFAAKVVLAGIATVGWPQIGDHFIGYPATGTLEIVSTDRHEGAKALSAWFAI